MITYDANARKVFSRERKHAVKARLHLLVPRHRREDDPEYDDRKQRDHKRKDQCGAAVDRAGHDKAAEHDERTAQKQPQKQVQSALHLVDIARHACDQRADAEGIERRIGKRSDMGKQRVPQPRSIAHRRLCRKILRNDRTAESDRPQEDKQSAARKNIAGIAVRNAMIDDIRHDDRYEQIEQRFQHFKQWRDHGLAAIAVKILRHALPVRGFQRCFASFHLKNTYYYSTKPASLVVPRNASRCVSETYGHAGEFLDFFRRV